MSKVKQIVVSGYKDILLHNVLIEQNGKGLAIFFPGVGYNNDMPLHYYSSKLLGPRGYDILKVNYRYNEREEFIHASLEEKKEWIRVDMMASVEQVVKKNQYDHILLVCKSIGTIAGLEYVSSFGSENVDVIWLTPLCHIGEVVHALDSIQNRSLIVIGTADSCYIKDNVEKLAAKPNYELLTIEGADHSLEIPQDIKNSLPIMETIVNRIDKFVVNLIER